MYKLAGRKKLGRKSSHRRALVNNLLRSLISSGKVVTTTPKAKVLKANIDALFTKLEGKKSTDIHYMLRDLKVQESRVDDFVSYLGGEPKVRIVKVGFRAGDNAEISRVSLMGFSSSKKQATPGSKNITTAEAPEVKKTEQTDLQSQLGKQKKETGGVLKRLQSSLAGKVEVKDRARSRSGI